MGARGRDGRTLINRRGLLKSGTAAGAAALGAGALGGIPHIAFAADDGHPDLILRNGRIHTMDDRTSIVSSVAIKNGKILSVGYRGPRGSPDTKTVDLAGRMAIPGIIEPHIHVVSLANRPSYHTILENTTSIIEVQQTLAERAREVPVGEWITSMGGWHLNQWAEHRLPTLAELDAACPNHPVLLYLRFTGPCATNSRGKTMFDAWDANPPVPHPQLVPVAASSTSAIAGGLFGLSPSTAALYHVRSLQAFEDKLRTTYETMQYAASVGETTQSDKVLFPTPGPLSPTQILSNLDQYEMYDAWLELDRNGMALTRLEINFLHNQGFISSLGDFGAQLPELRERLRNQFPRHGSDHLYVGGIGEWAAPLNVNRNTAGGEVWFELQRLVAEAGWRNENAVESLANLQGVITAWEELDATYGIKDKRYIIHHHPGQPVRRLVADAAAEPWRRRCDGRFQVGRFEQPDPGRRRTVPLHCRSRHQGRPPGRWRPHRPLNPWLHISYVVTGRNSFGAQVNPGQTLSREEALRLFTRENAWFITWDTTIGTIEPGKYADIAVLDQDYFTVSDEEIKEIRSAMTIVGGEVVHVDDRDESKWRRRGMFKRGRHGRRGR